MLTADLARIELATGRPARRTVWTDRESNSELVDANDAVCHLPIGPALGRRVRTTRYATYL